MGVLTGLWSAKLQNTEFSIKMSGVDTSSSSVPSVETQDNSCDNKMSETVKESSPSLENKETENIPETENKENNEIDNANEENSINESICGEQPNNTEQNLEEKLKIM